MSAPDTNIKKQERRHKPSLFGIKGSLIIVALLTIAFVFYLALSGASTDEDDGITGAGTSAVTTEEMVPNAEEPTPTERCLLTGRHLFSWPKASKNSLVRYFYQS